MTITTMMSWAHACEKERKTLADQRRMMRAKSEGALKLPPAPGSPQAEGQRKSQRSKRRKPEKAKAPYDVRHIMKVASPGFGDAAATVPVARDGSLALKPSELYPMTDGSMLPKPDRAPRVFADNYVFAV